MRLRQQLCTLATACLTNNAVNECCIYMNENKTIPKFTSYKDMEEFCDTHDLGEYWDQTEPAEFGISPQARRRYLVSVDRDLLLRVQHIAHLRGITTESLVNLLLEQRLHEVESQHAS